MSWLFDRLCDIASTDCVEIVVVAGIAVPACSDDEVDFADVLARASQIPQTTVDVYAPCAVEVPLFEPDAAMIELDGLAPTIRSATIKQHLGRVACGRDAHLRICGDELSVHADIDATSIGLRWSSLRVDDLRRRRVVVTDLPGHGDLLAGAAERGLAMSVGAVDPSANMYVPNVLGAASVLDALVTLRSFAFGLGCDLATSD